MHTIRTKKRKCSCSQNVSQPSISYMRGGHQIRALLPDLVNKQMNTNTCNKPCTSFYRKYVVRQMIFSTHCIVLNLTYDMRGSTYFLTCEVNIMPFFLLGSQQGLGVSLSIHINVMNYLLALPLQGEGSNKLWGQGIFRKVMSSLQSCLKNLCVNRESKLKIFKKIACFLFKNISSKSAE